ncbi:MAG: efflux RND transporter periplasmic adaptor subunit [Rhodocyclaceae bacterium]|nr:efflux RND transporter periplasmic adaptor subunit [Rhodocyclaceae bacterium]
MNRRRLGARSGAPRWNSLAASALVAIALAACSGGDAPPPATPEVNVVVTAVQPIPLDLKYSARTRGEREVEVHARVSGILLKRYYREGDHVAANALLFKIDPASFIAEVERLRGLEAMEKARLAEATEQRDRLVTLFGKGFISRRDRDAAVAAHASAQASADAARAALRQGELNLAYTEVRAPIAGITGRESRSEGSLVEAGAASSLLTTLVQSDRLYIDFALPEPEAQRVRAAMKRGPVSVRLAPGSKGEIAEAAKLEFLETRVDADSGTVAARALYENRNVRLAPGQFVVARVDGLSSPPGIYIPARAVLHTPEGAMGWVVDKDNKAQPRPLKLGLSAGNLVEVAEGLAAGERLISDGILKVQPGAAVKAVVVDITDPPGGPAKEPAKEKKATEQTK